MALPKKIQQLSLRLLVDGELRQSGGVSQMIHRPDAILRELEAYTTLEDGDIIMTGTPQGVGEVTLGQVFAGEVLCDGELLVAAAWVAQ